MPAARSPAPAAASTSRSSLPASAGRTSNAPTPRTRPPGQKTALPVRRQGAPASRIANEGGALPQERVGRGGPQDGGGKAGRHRGVERVAAAEEHPHAGHRHQGMPGGHHALGAGDDRARGRPVGGGVRDVAAGTHRRATRASAPRRANTVTPPGGATRAGPATRGAPHGAP